MNRLFFLLLFFIPFVFSCNSKKEKKISKKTEFKNGRWISTTDSLAGIEIKNGKWIMFYKGMKTYSNSIYDFKTRREYIKEIGAELEYLTITNDRSDTLKYAILEYSNELLSLSYIGRGNTLNYIPEKEKEEEKEATTLSSSNIPSWTDTINRLKSNNIDFTEKDSKDKDVNKLAVKKEKLIKTFHDNGQLKMEGVYADIDSLEFMNGRYIYIQENSGYYKWITFERGYFDDEKKMQITGIDAYRKATEKPIKDGKWTYYYESGKIEKEEFYNVNFLDKEINYSEKGFKTSKIEYHSKEGWLLADETKYYENGQIKSEYQEGYEDSYEVKYYENGQIESEDFGDGKITSYYENGQIESKDKGDGKITSYYKNGQIKTIKIVDRGFTFNGDSFWCALVKEYSETGKLTEEVIHLSTQLQKEFKDGISINGKIIFEKDYQLNPSTPNKWGQFRYSKKKLLK